MAALSPYVIQDLVSSWVGEDPRRLKLFLHLLSKMDDEGYVEISVRDFAKQLNMSREVASRILRNMEEHAIIEQISHQKRTIIFICKSERYMMVQHQYDTTMTPIQHQLPPSQKEKEETKASPCTPFKEKKEKKENVTPEGTSYQQQQQQPTQSEEKILSEPIEKRRERFWADCCHSHALHPEWPEEGVRSFFLFWTQPSKDGQRMKFEEEAHFGMSYRMKFYLKRGQWLDEVQEARLNRIKGRKAVSREEESYQRRRAAALAEDDAGREERDRQRDERAQKAATVEEIKAILGDRWVGDN